MNGSTTIRVLKRDGSVELFDAPKLAASLWRPMPKTSGCCYYAIQLSIAVEVYLFRGNWLCVSSAAVFEMSLKILRQVGLTAVAEKLEQDSALRNQRRERLRIRHDCGKVTHWQKSWLAEFAAKSWHLSSVTARILAGYVETDLLAGPEVEVERRAVIAMLNDYVAAFGLADAVPVGYQGAAQ